MEEGEKRLGEYLVALRRRKKELLVPIIVIFSFGVLAAFMIPSVYRAKATILIEQQEIPQDLVRSTVTTYADQRIQVISQRVMTSANLVGIIEKFNLYPTQRASEGIGTTIERMREDIRLQMVSADVIDPRSGRATQATIAFAISYDNVSPDLAQKVTNELVSLYLNENIKSRTQTTAETSEFLAAETAKLSAQVSGLESKLAEFKAQNVGSLPELAQLNLQHIERDERQLSEVANQLRALEERKTYLQSQLAQLSPTAILYSANGERILGPADRLKVLQAEYVSKAAVYAPNHPDLVKMRKEIGALKKTVGGGVDTSELEGQLAKLRADLVAARERYSNAHPNVKSLERRISGLESELASSAALAGAPRPTSSPDNPAYIQLRTQLEAAEAEKRALERTRKELKAKVASYEDLLTKMPGVEREYRVLTRDYENAVAKYQDIRGKQMEAELAEVLEKERKGERFSLIEPPLYPEDPAKPNRPAMLVLALVFSFVGGIGNVAIRENTDSTLRNARQVVSLLQMPPLAVIPYIENRSDRRRRFRKKASVAIVIIAVLGGALVLAHFFIMPLDVMWFTALRQL